MADNLNDVDVTEDNSATGSVTGSSEELKFSQSDIDKITGRTRKEASARFLKDLGYEDNQTLKNDLADLKKIREKDMTVVEKAQAALKDGEDKYSNASKENEFLRAENAALKLGINADTVKDFINLAMGFNGESIDEKMKEALKKYPHFKSTGASEETEEKKNIVTLGGKTGKETKSSVDAMKAKFKAQAGIKGYSKK